MRADGEDPVVTYRALSYRGFSYIHLLEGAGGVGKSVLLKAMQHQAVVLHLGAMILTAWTGVASAPFGMKTLCSLLGLDFTTLSTPKHMTSDQISLMRANFNETICDPKDLLVLVIDEISFVVQEVIHHMNSVFSNSPICKKGFLALKRQCLVV